MRWAGLIFGPIKHWVSNAQKFLQKKVMKYFEEKEKEFVYLHAQNGICFGEVHPVAGFFRTGIFFEKKPSRDCGIWKRVLYLHPLWAERADWKRTGKFTDILNWQRRESPETVLPNKENKPFWVPKTLISLVVKTLAVARPPEDLTMKSLILAQDER